ncbi:unnamed protein product, partial [Laminaria digitata]
PASNEEGTLGRTTSSKTVLQAVAPIAAAVLVDGADGRNLSAALDQKATERATREAKYEEKRRRYLATKNAASTSTSSTSEKSRGVHFGQDQQ